MEFVNQTSFPGEIFRMYIDEERLAAAAVLRVTYRLVGKRLVPDDEQPWRVSSGPWESPRGMMEGDFFFYRSGVDVFLFGSARAMNGRKTSSLDVSLKIGSGFSRTVRVQGVRVWQKGIGRLRPTAPIPFEIMPLSLDQAFGGTVDWDGLKISWPDNPVGVGFYADVASAVDHPLPNIEEIDQLIEDWDDRPTTAGLTMCAIHSPLRLQNAIKAENNSAIAILPQINNAAFPRMNAKQINPGDAVRLLGVAESAVVEFEIPRAPALIMIDINNNLKTVEPAADQLGIDIDEQRVFISYRYPFRYRFVPMQRRICKFVPQ